MCIPATVSNQPRSPLVFRLEPNCLEKGILIQYLYIYKYILFHKECAYYFFLSLCCKIPTSAYTKNYSVGSTEHCSNSRLSVMTFIGQVSACHLINIKIYAPNAVALDFALYYYLVSTTTNWIHTVQFSICNLMVCNLMVSSCLSLACETTWKSSMGWVLESVSE